jgi:hypothetical protein
MAAAAAWCMSVLEQSLSPGSSLVGEGSHWQFGVCWISGPEFGVGGTSSEEQQMLHGVDVDEFTCTDILMALQEVGDSLSHHSLEQYFFSVHCSSSVVDVTA